MNATACILNLFLCQQTTFEGVSFWNNKEGFPIGSKRSITEIIQSGSMHKTRSLEIVSKIKI
jgi:hypothetical protein